MDLRLDFISILILLGMLQAVYQMVILSSSGWKNHVNRWLILLLFFSFFILLGYFTYLSGVYRYFPYLVGISGPLLFGIGPAIFLYCKALFKDSKSTFISFIHFIPVLLFFILDYSWFITTKEYKIRLIEYYYSGQLGFKWVTFIYLGVILLHLGSYLIITAQLAFKGVHQVMQKESNTSLIKLRFIKIILVAFMIYLLVYLSVYLSWSVQSSYTTQIEAYLQLVLSLFVLTFGYHFIRNYGVFIPEHVSVQDFSKYKSSTLEKDIAKDHAHYLKQCMEQEKYYLDPKLSLQQLAAEVSLKPHQLSQVINQELGMNFFDFINGYRIEETKKKLLSPACKHLSILGIAFECGFNSKGAFNRIFKKFEGVSPSQYIKKYR
ncbi:helix-turn-helix domain-containing protein [Ascidiimonas sp. W6]|uniref:helix-turn-helix domain-containing protein n=1 Tax=Ascidiimonas meishanensis TaxID=3128903 RepID=UPI0030EC040F